MEKNKYTEEEIIAAKELLGDSLERPENMEYELYVQVRRENKLMNKLDKLGTFHHVSASLIPKLGADGKMKVPVEWIGKTKGDTYENFEKQKSRKMELFMHYMILDEKEKAQKVADNIGLIDEKLRKENG
jgi:hypothetical protein